jgi:hypothetical protein
VVDSIEQIRVMVQQNAESATELASSSEELSRQASLMRELTERFHVSMNGHGAAGPRVPPPPPRDNGGVRSGAAEGRASGRLMQAEPARTPFAGR